MKTGAQRERSTACLPPVCTPPASAADAGQRALDLMQERGEITGSDLRDAGLCATASMGFAVLLDLERSGHVERTGKGWRRA